MQKFAANLATTVAALLMVAVFAVMFVIVGFFQLIIAIFS